MSITTSYVDGQVLKAENVTEIVTKINANETNINGLSTTKVDKVTGKSLVSDTTITDLTDTTDTSLHYHSSDRNRSNHTGTQSANSINDFANSVRTTLLTGLSTTVNNIISPTDTMVGSLGKLQKQLNDLSEMPKGNLYNSAIMDMISSMSEESLKQLCLAIASGTVKIAFVGDSITEGYDQTNLKDNYVERFIRMIRDKFPTVVINYINFALTGRTLENFVSPTFHDYSLVGSDLCQERKWITDTSKVWREYVKDYQPDLLFIAFGVNDSCVIKINGEDKDKYFIGNLEYFRTEVLNTYAKMPSVCLVTSLLGTTNEADAISVFGYMPSEVITQNIARVVRHYAKDKEFGLVDANRLWLLARDGKDDVKRASVWERNCEGFNTSNWIGDKSSFTLTNNTLTQNVVGKYVSRPKMFYEGSIEMDIIPVASGANGILYINIRTDVDLGNLLWNIKPSNTNDASDSNISLYRQSKSGGYTLLGTSQNLIMNTGTSYKIKFESVGNRHICYVNGVNTLEVVYYGNMHDGFITLGSPNTMPSISNLILSYEEPLLDTPMYTNADLIGLPPYDDKSTSGDGLHHPTGLGYAVTYASALLGVVDKAEKSTSFILPTIEDWKVPTLLNNWVDLGGTEETAGYYKDYLGIVHLKGSIKSGLATSGTVLFNLPVGYRPSYTKIFSCVSNSEFGALGIQTNGNVVIVTGTNLVFSFDGITFRI